MRFLPTLTLLTVLTALSGAVWHGAPDEPGASHSHRKATTGGDRLAPLKPMSALAFVEPKRYLLHSGETVRVSLTLVASESAQRVMVAARSDAGTQIVSKPQFFLGELSAGQKATVWFDVTVLAEGRHYVSVVAQAETSEGVRLSSYAVPVETHAGNPLEKSDPSPPAVFDSDGNRLRLMPASRPERDRTTR